MALGSSAPSAAGNHMPVIVLNQKMEREVGRRAQQSNILAGKTVADVVRTCLGPRAMLKMLLDPMGGIVLTSDGNAILREIDVAHPAAKSVIELSRTQDEEVGDGTTSVIVLAGEILALSSVFLTRYNLHPTTIIKAYKRALDDALLTIEACSRPIDVSDDAQLTAIIASSLSTKFTAAWSALLCSLAIKSVRTVASHAEAGKKGNGAHTARDIDIKRFARIEKVPGGEIGLSTVLDGVLLGGKDVTHPSMRRVIQNPRILLLDTSLEYKKGESQTAIEISSEAAWTKALEAEEEAIRKMCASIVALRPDVLVCEKGVSDLAQHFLAKANITAIRRVRKTDNLRIARATGATIVSRVESAKESDIGTRCGLFKVEKIGDEYFTHFVECRDPSACTILLRAPSKDLLNEVERNLHDAMCVCRNLLVAPRLVPGGGACEMAVAAALRLRSKEVAGVEQLPYRAIADALEVIPRTLVQNCGGNAVRVMTELRARHASCTECDWGVDGVSTDARLHRQSTAGAAAVYEAAVVKAQSLKTAVECACLLLRVDEIASGLPKPKDRNSSSSVATSGPNPEDYEED